MTINAKRIVSTAVFLFQMIFSACCANLALAEVLLVEDGRSSAQIPEKFRTTASKTDLKNLHISGSAQFSASNLDYILHNIPKKFSKDKIFIVDLRQESHGFIDGIAVTWYANQNHINVGKKPLAIKQEEEALLHNISKDKNIEIHQYKKVGEGWIKSSNIIKIVNIKYACTEKNLVKKSGLQYKRFYVPDHGYPENDEVDRFLAFMRDLPKDAWVHFHCRAGRGRTTLFMVMYDILRNGKQLSLNDIVQRQIAIGGSKIDQLVLDKNDKWKEEAAQRRYRFVQDFYAYVTDPQGYAAKRAWGDYVNSVAQDAPLRTAPSNVAG